MTRLRDHSRPTRLVLSSLLIVLLAATTLVAHGATVFSDDFEDGNSSGWSPSGGSWSVVSDGSQVYRQTGTSADARALTSDTAWTDQIVSVRVKPLSFNGANRFVAVAARAQSTTSYYYLALRSNNTVELKKLVSGSSTTLATASFSVATGQWYTLTLAAQGSSLTGSVNGQILVSAGDTRFASGRAGVATFYASASFDDLSVSTPNGMSTPTPIRTATATGIATATATATRTATPTSPSATPTATSTVPTATPLPPGEGPIGFASVNALGQNGTTGGAGGSVVTATNTDDFLRYIDTTGPLVIQVQGTIQISSKKGVRPNKTIIGLGSNAEITGGGLDFYRSYNVIVRNIKFTNADDDSINIGQESHHIWIDHCDFSNGADGLLDIVREADYVTVSWNRFHHHSKTMLIGHSDGYTSDVGKLKVSIHHNMFDGTDQRHPRVRFGEPVHVFNNYFRNNSLYGIATTENAGVLVEGNYFENVPFPILVGYADSGPGRAVERNNVYVNSGAPQTAGTVAEPRSYYNYTLDNPNNIPSIVQNGAGVGKIR